MRQTLSSEQQRAYSIKARTFMVLFSLTSSQRENKRDNESSGCERERAFNMGQKLLTVQSNPLCWA